MPDIATMEELSLSIKGWKDSQEAILNQMKEELRIAQKSASAYEADRERLEGLINSNTEYAQNLEKQLKGKTLTPAEQKSFNEQMGEEIGNKWEEIKLFEKKRKGASVKLSEFKAPADMGLNVSVANAGAYFTTVQPGIRTLPNRKVHMRQLIPLGSMSGSTLTYMREIAGGEGTPQPWAENSGAKQQIDMNFEEVTVDAEYIAGYVRVSRKMLDDMAAFRSYLQMRLMEMYWNAEDNQILNGTGVGSQITGLLTVAQQNTVTTGINVERLIKGIALLESTNYTATGIITHPVAYYDIAINKSTGSGEYDLPSIVVIQNGQVYVAGVPMYKTTAIAYNKYLIGDFAMGCQFFIREQPVVEFFEQDQDNVIKNLFTVRVEGRAALAIYRTEAFVQGTFQNITPIVS